MHTKVKYLHFKESFISEPFALFWIKKQLIHLLHITLKGLRFLLKSLEKNVRDAWLQASQ